MAAFEVIAHTELSSSAYTVTFSSIPNTYQHLYLVSSARSIKTSYTAGGNVILNEEESSGDYTMSAFFATGPSTPGAYDTIGDPQPGLSYAFGSTGASQETGVYSSAHLWILDYAATDKYTGMIGGQSSPGYSGDTNDYQHTMIHGHLTFTDAVHTLKIKASTQLAAGTAFTLYGINSA